MRPEFFEPFPTIADLRNHLKSRSETASITAEQFIKNNLPKEDVFQSKIISALKDWRANRLIDPASMIWKKSAGVYNNMNGLPDIMMISNGLFFGFEVKRPYIGRLTLLQKKRISEINLAGGYAEAVCYANEVKMILIKAGAWSGGMEKTNDS